MEFNKRQRELGLKTFAAEETAGRFSKKLKQNAEKNKFKYKITGTVDDINSIVFNTITDRK